MPQVIRKTHNESNTAVLANQATVTLWNPDEEIGGMPIFDPSTQSEVQALRDKCTKSWPMTYGRSRC
jgi:hypothetical protein